MKKEDGSPNKNRGESGLYARAEPRQLDAFDIDLLRLLPDLGAKKGKYLPDALGVPAIKRALDPTLTSGFVSVRLRSLRDEGYVSSVSLVGQGRNGLGWQRTKKGKDTAFEGLGINGVLEGGAS